jgi:hypothetical protein
MSRLRRFPDLRFIGLRDTMKVYDCDDNAQFALLEERVTTDSLVNRNLVSSFGPDTEVEAINRGFRPA